MGGYVRIKEEGVSVPGGMVPSRLMRYMGLWSAIAAPISKAQNFDATSDWEMRPMNTVLSL